MRTGKQWREENRAKRKREEAEFREGLRRTREERRKFAQSKYSREAEEFWRKWQEEYAERKRERDEFWKQFNQKYSPRRNRAGHTINGAYVSDKVRDPKKREIILALRAKGLDRAVTTEEKMAYLAKAGELEAKYSI